MTKSLAALAFLAGIGDPVPTPTATRLTVDDLAGSWELTIGTTDEPTCNDTWSVTEGGKDLGQGRGKMRIFRADKSWKIARQKTYFLSGSAPVEVLPLTVTTGTAGTFTLAWAGETRTGYVERTNDIDVATRLVLHDKATGYFGNLFQRCPVLPNQPVDAVWTPPEATIESYLRCERVYTIAKNGLAAMGGTQAKAAGRMGDLASTWSRAASKLKAATGDRAAAERAINERWAAVQTNEQKSLQMLQSEMDRCGGRPPLSPRLPKKDPATDPTPRPTPAPTGRPNKGR